MKRIIEVPRPQGEFTIDVNGYDVYSKNLFTRGGIREIYKSGKNTIIDSNGGVFSYCKIGNGDVPLGEDSTGLSGNISMTSTLVSSTLEYFTNDEQRYAKGIFVYTFSGEYIGDITEIMLSKTNDNNGMLCGRTLDVPIPISRGDEIKITYCVTIPIFSNDVVLATGTSDGEVYYLIGKFFQESPTTLTAIFPTSTGMVTNGNVSRVFDEGVLLNEGTTRVSSVFGHTGKTLSYRINVGVLGNPNTTYIKELTFGNSDANNVEIENFPLTFRYGTRVLKPTDIDWGLDFTLELEFPNVY